MLPFLYLAHNKTQTMKQRILLFATIILIGCNHAPQGSNHLDSATTTRQIIVMHPTVNNLKTFLYLTENALFPLPKDYRVVGVYHAKEIYDYKKAQKFIDEQGLSNVSLLKVDNVICADSLYAKNSCTELFTKLFNESQGAIFFGGPDIPPFTYGDSTNLLTVVTDPNRHYMELSFLFQLLGGNQNVGFKPLMDEKPDFRILGICLGMQTMNVATGGTLYQDIPTELYGKRSVESVLAMDANQQHRNYNTNFTDDTSLIWGGFHQIYVVPGAKIVSLLSVNGVRPFVLSSHHQSVKKLGMGLRVAAWSIDGKVVEAIEHNRFPNVIGLQFHPEPTLLYERGIKIKIQSNKPAEQSFEELYPGEKGASFHIAFWAMMGEMYK